MPNIIPYDDTPIIDEEAMAKKHIGLVNHLKESLYIGQAGFIKAGQYLTEIKKENTYKFEDSQQDITWPDFIMRSDLPLGGITKDGRLRTAQKLMTVWENIASRKEIDKKLLAKIGYTKLALVAGVINKDPKADLNEWLAKAEQLSTPDLQAEVGDGGKTLAEINNCKHTNYEKVDAWRCKDCGKFFKTEPNKENVKEK